MKMIFALMIVLILTGLCFILFNKKKSSPGTSTVDNPYEGLKNLAYSTKYSQLNLGDPGDKEILYGVIMDWDYEGKAIITLVSLKTGDASLYFSSGTGIIGAGQHQEVNIASKEFIEKAQTLLPLATDKDSSLTTEKGVLKFYLLTTKGKYVVKDKIQNVTNHTSELTTMFQEANKLIAYINMANEKMEQQTK